MTAGAESPLPPAQRLPDGLVSYRRTPEFTETTIPAGLLKTHSTKAGTWGLIRVTEGALRYRIADPRRSEQVLCLDPDSAPGVVEPTIEHEVAPLGTVRFHVEFFREALETVPR